MQGWTLRSKRWSTGLGPPETLRRSSCLARARGDARPDSDYDLLLIEPSDRPRYRRAARYRRALVGLAPAKDILVWTPEEVAEWREVPNAFITAALSEGMVLYES